MSCVAHVGMYLAWFVVYCGVLSMADSQVKSSQSQGYCSQYNGKVCKNYLDTTARVWFNSSLESAGGDLNENIVFALWKEMSAILDEPCKKAAEKLLCTYAFPQCVTFNGIPTSLPLCYEDCIAVRYSFCYNNWALIEENKARGIRFKSRGHFELPNCDQLPRFEVVNGKPSCSHAELTVMKDDEITYDCIKGRGRFYQGTVNTTVGGLACQHWDSKEPHAHERPPPVFPELNQSENYCRNAGGEEPSPWCYTMDPKVRWQRCDIPVCADNGLDDVTSWQHKLKALLEQFLSQPYFIVLAVIFIPVASMLCLICVVCVIRLVKRNVDYAPAPSQEVNIDLSKLPCNASYHQTDARLNPKLEQLEFPRNDIIYMRDLGQGAFGRVFQAKAPGLLKHEEFTLVAVKMLKDEASEYLQTDFEREACLLAEFDHPNIVKLLGVCAVGNPMCLLFEYMGRGDLNDFLRICSPNNYISIENSIHRPPQLSTCDLITIALQIASGMVYLSDRKFVHRDLATRNCLINDQMVVKIADFGLSRKMYLQDYYKGDENDAIPVRWMPLESILYNKYTVESDVWAFGVCLWEIFSYALQPYYGLTHEEVVKYIKDGNILQSSDNTPESLYELMKLCWNRKPMNRPSFRTIYQSLWTVKQDLEH